eukprot:TRINITY_DN1628_c0_g1_i4.p2 TRINITY_DN1628_c0_g1~~TRINITY_DN1628_c0_g1_i4.p2  ORF type:complete len:107 (+),score=4.79 TRINITY_DN1628_c0_g1_i4:166-486(+)
MNQTVRLPLVLHRRLLHHSPPYLLKYLFEAFSGAGGDFNETHVVLLSEFFALLSSDRALSLEVELVAYKGDYHVLARNLRHLLGPVAGSFEGLSVYKLKPELLVMS